MITKDDIKADTNKYDRRIMRLKCQLQDLPQASTRNDRKKVKKLHEKMAHVENLRRIALDALEGKFDN